MENSFDSYIIGIMNKVDYSYSISKKSLHQLNQFIFVLINSILDFYETNKSIYDTIKYFVHSEKLTFCLRAVIDKKKFESRNIIKNIIGRNDDIIFAISSIIEFTISLIFVETSINIGRIEISDLFRASENKYLSKLFEKINVSFNQDGDNLSVKNIPKIYYPQMCINKSQGSTYSDILVDFS